MGVSTSTLSITSPIDQQETDTLRFDEASHMPPMIDLASSGLRRSNRLAGKNLEKRNGISFFHKDLFVWHRFDDICLVTRT